MDGKTQELLKYIELIRISEEIKIKLGPNQTDFDISSNTLGIDIGQSLTKISYLEENEILLKMIPTRSNFSDIIEFIDVKKENLKT